MFKNLTTYDYVKLILVTAILICGLLWQINSTLQHILQNYTYTKNQLKLDELTSLLKIYTVSTDNSPITLARFGRSNDGGYVVPTEAVSAADAIMGYGIADDISFEEHCAEIFSKPTYGFDCGISSINTRSKWLHFVPQCIATANFLYFPHNSSQKVTSFTQQINELVLNDKRIFIKMDIEGAEYEAFKDIYQYHADITGLVLEIHFDKHNIDSLNKAIQLMKRLNKNFFLLHVHGNNYSAAPNQVFTSIKAIGHLPLVLELTYINKSLVTAAELSGDQTHPTKLDMPNKLGAPEMLFEILD